MKKLMLGIVFVASAQSCLGQTPTGNDNFFHKSDDGEFKILQKTENGEKEVLTTDALNIHYETHPVLNRGKSALFVTEMWEFGNVLSIYNGEKDLWILRNYENVYTQIETTKPNKGEFTVFLSDEGFRDRVPYSVLPVPMKIIDDEKVLDFIGCDSESFVAITNRSEKFLIDNQAKLTYSTKSIISDHLSNLKENCS